jgi:tyrosine-protein kinase Etk/Wzc
LAKQYEIAKFQEAAESGPIQGLDIAVTPDKKSKPARLVLTLLAGALGILISLTAAVLLEATQQARKIPGHAQLLDELREHLSLRLRK